MGEEEERKKKKREEEKEEKHLPEAPQRDLQTLISAHLSKFPT